MAIKSSPLNTARWLAAWIELHFNGFTHARKLPKRPLLIAIDGRCAAGKTTLAACLKDVLEARFEGLRVCIFHMDDFYLRPEQRTEARYAEAGGNVDRERFASEVLRPLLRNKGFSYRPFDCATMSLAEPIRVSPVNIAIIEGSYSCHPALRKKYDVRVFLSISREKQLKRILARNGSEKLGQFIERWIPLEEKYFKACKVRNSCDIRLDR